MRDGETFVNVDYALVQMMFCVSAADGGGGCIETFDCSRYI
jgi:hypothetical protein